MIYISPSTVMVISSDGTKKAFNSEDLQTKLVNSCISAGIKDYWLAEDISNAVESALSFQSENGITFSESEISSFVLKILEDTGFPSVAESFKKDNKISIDSIIVNLNTLKSLFRTRFGLKEKDMATVADRVLKACKLLKIQEAEPQLLTELGRHYKNKEIRGPEIDTFIFRNSFSSPWILSAEEIESMLSPETIYFIENKLINLNGISSLFPSLKIDISLEPLAEIYKLEPIITELILYPCYRKPCESVNETIKEVSKYLIDKNIISANRKLPVYLRFPDIYKFSEKYLGAGPAGKTKFCRNTVAAGFVENLNYPVFVKGLR
ncbi:MAG: hypothetical protein K9M56_09135 [Victivallales bacterium]|nr:hypothetical protein [Victivallales bacterium]